MVGPPSSPVNTGRSRALTTPSVQKPSHGSPGGELALRRRPCLRQTYHPLARHMGAYSVSSVRCVARPPKAGTRPRPHLRSLSFGVLRRASALATNANDGRRIVIVVRTVLGRSMVCRKQAALLAVSAPS